jgi:hypothetical protein
VIGGPCSLASGPEGQSSPEPRTDGHAAVLTLPSATVSCGLLRLAVADQRRLPPRGPPI